MRARPAPGEPHHGAAQRRWVTAVPPLLPSRAPGRTAAPAARAGTLSSSSASAVANRRGTRHASRRRGVRERRQQNYKCQHAALRASGGGVPAPGRGKRVVAAASLPFVTGARGPRRRRAPPRLLRRVRRGRLVVWSRSPIVWSWRRRKAALPPPGPWGLRTAPPARIVRAGAAPAQRRAPLCP